MQINGIWHSLPIWAQATAVIILYVYPAFALVAIMYLRKKETRSIQYGFGASKKRKKWAGVIWKLVLLWLMMIVGTLLCYGAFEGTNQELRKISMFLLGISPLSILVWRMIYAKYFNSPPKWPEPLGTQKTG